MGVAGGSVYLLFRVRQTQAWLDGGNQTTVERARINAYEHDTVDIGVSLVQSTRAALAFLSLTFLADVLAGIFSGSSTPRLLLLYQISAICVWLASYGHTGAPLFFSYRMGNLVSASMWLVAVLVMCAVFVVCYAWHATKSTKYRMAVTMAANRLEAAGQVASAQAMRRMDPTQHLKVRTYARRGQTGGRVSGLLFKCLL